MLACGGNVAVPGNTGGGGASSSSSSSTGSSSSGTTTATGGAGGADPCSAIGSEVACLGAFPDCVPVYDDECCPSCDPTAGCADCVDIHFHHCAPTGTACVKAPSCGFAPPWACAGSKADCGIEPGGALTPCHSAAGCTAGYCPTDVTCKTDPVCVPVTKGSCTALCGGVAPPCPPGTIAENDGSCFTGLCIPAGVCAP